LDGVGALPPLDQAQAQCHQRQAELLKTQITDLERALHPHLVPDEQVQRLLWIPGIGKTVAFTIRLEIGDRPLPDREAVLFVLLHPRCFLVPGAGDSGGNTSHSHRKDGDKYLKIAFNHASVRAVQYYPAVRAFFERKRREKPEAIVRAVGAKEIARIEGESRGGTKIRRNHGAASHQASLLRRVDEPVKGDRLARLARRRHVELQRLLYSVFEVVKADRMPPGSKRDVARGGLRAVRPVVVDDELVAKIELGPVI